MDSPFAVLQQQVKGKLYYGDDSFNNAMRMVYATDASVYQEKPVAVALPETVEDIRHLIGFAQQHQYTIIPRAAGTSLAGQVVGDGIVADISKHFTSIIEINQEEKWVRVQPGIIRDDLNVFLKPYGLMFGPETSTSNRAMIGGMIGNNSSGLHSIIWSDTRNNLLEVKAVLSDGTEIVCKDLTKKEFNNKCSKPGLEGDIYRSLHELFSKPENRSAIENGFPKSSIKRRNTGYALDALLRMWSSEDSFNLCKLIAGSEGTLCFITEAKLRLLDLPPKEKGIIAVHTMTIKEALKANLIALKHNCDASELVDDFILEFTKTNIDQSKNRFFVEGEPRAILMVEFFSDTAEGLLRKAEAFTNDVKTHGLGYAYPLLLGKDTDKAWDLRKSGLGLLRNEPGDTQCVNLIEDCAVDVEDLPDYVDEVEALLKFNGVKYAMYAHAGAGELHIEPMINLKTNTGKHLFHTILKETVSIVKKYNGSLSGEHGDGRLRGEFIPFIMGEKNYELFKQVKKIFDPHHIFNRGKITDTPPMNGFLRFEQDQPKKEIKTVFDFSKQEGILRLTEKCSGSGDCRKSQVSGGTMCPSYMATRSEQDTTRARANILRHFYNDNATESGIRVGFEEVKSVLDLCLSCKGCKAECPSSVDVGKMKAEFTQQYHDKFGVPMRSRLVGNFTRQMKMAAVAPWAYNFIFGTSFIRRMVNSMVGFHPERSMPLLHTTTLRKWFLKAPVPVNPKPLGVVNLFCDEFTDYHDVRAGQKLILLLRRLGYTVRIPDHIESGRTYLSKGLVREAKKIAIKNVELLKDVVTPETPLIGIEPSAVLTLRDEYLELVPFEQMAAAKRIAKNTFLFDEWFAREIENDNISPDAFTDKAKTIHVHGHCHQKALSSLRYTLTCLSLPVHYKALAIPSGCCGMAGSFGYEKEHYAVSMQIGELVLFPAIRKLQHDELVAAPGTSCRHQIKDGTTVKALHPAEILYDALAT